MSIQEQKNLEKRIDEARADFNEDYNPPAADTTNSDSANIGYEFLAYIISGGIFGYGLDYFLGSIPLFMILFLIVGLAYGAVQANKRTQALNNKDNSE